MADVDPAIVRANVEEAEQARAARARQGAALTPSERLERVHELGRQLAAIRPVGEDPR